MLGFFLEPFPDETFHSLCSRLSDTIGEATVERVLQALFGVSRHKVDITFPSRIGNLISQIPTGAGYSCDELIEGHTLLPFYRPFLAPEQARALRQYMIDGDNGLQIVKSGPSRAIKYQPAYLRYCPKCVRADIVNVGEPYWHRVHQVPGVLVCPEHIVYLEFSPVVARNRVHSEELRSARRTILRVRPRVVNCADPDESKLMRLAQDASDILQQPTFFCGPGSLMRRYRTALLGACPGTHMRRIVPEKVRQQFIEFYSPKLLRTLGVEVDKLGSWFPLQRMWSEARPVVQSPLMHLLLMQFLGDRPSEFFNRAEVPEPFGVGPWPCLNPECDFYRKDVINEVIIKFVRPPRNGYCGQFLCQCGFQYLRYQSSGREQYHKVSQHGHVWEKKLRNLWMDPAMSINRMATFLGVSPTVIHWRARALHLEAVRPVPQWLSQLSGSRPHRRITMKKAEPLDLEKYRKALTGFLEQYPGATRTDVHKRIPWTWRRLRQYDSPWLNATLPPPRQQKRPGVDWASRDRALAVQVQAAIETIRRRGNPRRIGRISIAREMGSIYLIGCNLDRLPQTAEILRKNVEFRTVRMVRRSHGVTGPAEKLDGSGQLGEAHGAEPICEPKEGCASA